MLALPVAQECVGWSHNMQTESQKQFRVGLAWAHCEPAIYRSCDPGAPSAATSDVLFGFPTLQP